jgi:hypothetical protein
MNSRRRVNSTVRRNHSVVMSSYLGSFELLSNDFRRLGEYVEPADANLNTYSHRLYELLLRACTDFESVCKEQLVSSRYAKAANDMNINDYKTLEAALHLEQFYVGVLIWRPAPVYIQPFTDWSTAAPPLSWYAAYNTVKHNRNAEFAHANLENVRNAISGLFALLAALDIISKNTFGHQERAAPNGLREDFYPGYIFTLAH